jgi:hypothetical protein
VAYYYLKKKYFHEKFPSCTSLNIIENLQPIFECVLQAVFFLNATVYICLDQYTSNIYHFLNN